MWQCSPHHAVTNSTSRDQARILEQRAGLGSTWMSVIPNQSLHTSIPSEDYVLGLKWWLGVPIIHENNPDRSCSGFGGKIDPWGDHMLCCPRNNFQRRHEAVREALADLLVTAGQPFRREFLLRDHVAAQELRTEDLLIDN